MASWDEQISRGGLQVKGRRASVHQAQMMHLIVTETRKRGGDTESQAGAVATAIQESGVTNISHGDRDSLGLYQQRHSMGWGSPAQIMTPTYAIKKFLDLFLAYRRKGAGWLTASHKTQRSAFASAPAKWYGEGLKAARYFGGAGANLTPATGLNVSAGGSTSVSGEVQTRTEPYEFSRGTPDKTENTWEALGRLAEEVGWRRCIRRGELWFVSENYLNAQKPVFTLSDLSPGVIDLSFDWETRLRRPAEAQIKLQARRYELAVGDTVDLKDMGPGSGHWLVTSTRRILGQSIVEVALARPTPKGAEPAAAKTTVQSKINVSTSLGGSSQPVTSSGAISGAEPRAQKAYNAAQHMSNRGIPYSQARRNLIAAPPSADCSSSTSWVLMQAGIPLPGNVRAGGWAPVSGAFVNWGAGGKGKFFTIYCNAGHIWIRWNGIGPAWRFDTAGGRSGEGPRQRTTPTSTAPYRERHWPGC